MLEAFGYARRRSIKLEYVELIRMPHIARDRGAQARGMEHQNDVDENGV